jgi:DNA-binding GntR family transcriptional regulator
MIVQGRLAPGSRIIETEVASRLGVSRTPVRAALQRLEQEGYIRTANSGQRWRPSVAPLTNEDSEELFNIIGQLEGVPASLAAKLEGEDRHKLVPQLRDMNGRLVQASEEGTSDPAHYFELDRRFHQAFVEAVAGPRRLALLYAVKPQAERYARVYTSALLDQVEVSAEEHEVAIRAIEDGDPDAAQRAIEANWRGAAQRLGEVIERLGEKGTW